jgi:hypothetical protein
MKYIINSIRLFHFILIIFLLISPYFSKEYCKNSLVILIYIFYKWKVNGSCGLTNLEHKLTGKKEEDGFIYRIVNPYLSIRETTFKKKLEIITLILIVFYYFMFTYVYK